MIRPRRWAAALVAGSVLGWLVWPHAAAAADTTWGHSLRAFVFARLGSLPDSVDRRDTELAIYRITQQTRFDNDWRINAHAVLTLQSPPATAITGVATATTRTYLPLDGSIAKGSDASLRAEMDRLNVQGRIGRVRLVAGRQAITWGTNYFWPALDLFAPFAPNRLDRDYKPGVDALRMTLPIGDFSEIEAVAAVQGESSSDDASTGMLARLNFGRTDLGFMGGRFHGDNVLGGFVTADVRGATLRAEVTHTRSGDAFDAGRDRRRFWRGSVGFDRLINPVLMITAEVAFNGYGVSEPARYLAEVASADRVSRGEVNALGRRHVGLALAWDLHPLWSLDNTLLANLNDSSVLWVPAARWSTGNESEVMFGAQLPVGPRIDASGRARSEYGLAARTLFASFTGYF